MKKYGSAVGFEPMSSGLQTYQVLEEDFAAIFSVVPMADIEPLSEELDGRLCAVLLLGRHVEVVHEHDTLLAHRRTKHALATAVQLRHNYVLRLIG